MLIDAAAESRRDSSAQRAGPAAPVVFIACAGRSGSTLIDRILGAHDGFCSTGEIRFIWERSFLNDELCGCGVPFRQCLFWGEVSARAFGTAPGVLDVSAAARLRGCLDATRQAPWLLSPRAPAAHTAMAELYTGLLSRLFTHALEVSGARAIVDSSGDGAHGLLLARTRGVELHVVHLIRDPRAVAFSWTRARERPEIHWGSERMPTEDASTSARRWVLHNLLAESLSRSAASYQRLRYEDFVLAPERSIRQILAPHSWATAPLASLEQRKVILKPSHTVSGNPLRFKQGLLKISLDDEWRRAMEPRDRRTVNAITWPLLARYGYSLSGE